MGAPLARRAPPASLVELDPAPVRRDQHGKRARADRARGRGVLRVRRAARARRRESPGDDLISKLIAAEEEGERLSDDECINLVFNILVGGVDTSQSQLAHAIRLLAERPEQWELLVRDPALAAAAVEEALRYEPITPFTARILTDDVVFRGVTFPEGHSRDGLCLHRQPRPRRGEGEEFDITVERDRARPLTFGAGVHYCLGANLARAELQEGLAFLSQNMRALELDGEPIFEGVSGIYGLAELPISFSV